VSVASAAVLAAGRTANAESAAAVPESFSEALTRVARARAVAEAASAPVLAARSYQAAITLESEAHQFAKTGRSSDAVLRAAAAEARFRASEVEARAESDKRERVDAPPSVAESPRSETRQPQTEEGFTDLTNDERSIRSVIAQYVSGLESRNLAALKRVWPSLGGIQEQALRTEFRNARMVQAMFENPRITINDDTTTVTGVRSYSLVTRDGQQLSSVTRTTITLRRNGDAWVIEQIVHNQ
jgi:hypothetical protein